MSPLSILHTESSIGWGGQELRILTEMEGMVRRGHRVQLLTADSADILPAAQVRGLAVTGAPIEAKTLAGLRALRAWMRRHGGAFDVINTHSSTDAWLVALARATLPRMAPVVRTRHVSTPVNNSATTRWLYQRATAHLVVTGEALAAQLVRDNRYDPARITSVRTGIDLGRFRRLNRLQAHASFAVDARPAVAIVATLRDWKGHDDLFDAWLLLRTRVPGWQLLVIGDGPRRAHLEGRVAELGLDRDVRFTGNQDDVPSWFACAEIAVLPSYGDEGVPQSLMQAAACGLPAVSTPIGAIAEAVRDGETGLLVPPRDPQALATALSRLMGDPSLRSRMGAAAHAYAQANFGIDRMLDGMERVFEQVVKGALMCGIAGHFGTPVGADVRQRMLAALARRGPDARHVASFDAAGSRVGDGAPAAAVLVHARLSIIDPRPVADQPMGTDDGALWITYNGEVYDWQDDARTLADQGLLFRTRSDTEFILRGYEAWGIEGLLPRLRGMFAFAIVDFRSRRVHVVRDRLGLKPVVYAHGERGFAFASTVRSVLSWLPRAQRGFSADAIDAYLAHRYVPAPRTIFEHVARLPNAHRLEYDLDTGALALHRYWSPRPVAAVDCGALLDQAIELRLVADRPLGLFLSGGIDSGTIACRLAATGHQELRSFSAAFPGSPFDESEEAARTAQALGLRNERIIVPTSIGDDFAEIVATLDEPFADPSSFPTWYLARAAQREVKVVLGGDGGDELFAGYKRIAKHLRNAWRGNLRLPLPVLPDARPKGIRKALGELSLDWESAYALRFSGLTPNQRRFLQPARMSIPAHYWREPDLEPATREDRLLRWDFANYLPEYVLRKADLCTMAHGLELRAPLLDHRFVEAILALPARERFTSPPKRYLARLAPELERLGAFSRKKRGFNPPLAGWLDHDLAPRLPLVAESLAHSTGGQIDAGRVRTMLDAYASTPALAEQVLSLVILDESLQQLCALRDEGDPSRAD